MRVYCGSRGPRRLIGCPDRPLSRLDPPVPMNLPRSPRLPRAPARRLSLPPLEDRTAPAVGDLLATMARPAGTDEFGHAVAASTQYLAVGAPDGLPLVDIGSA